MEAKLELQELVEIAEISQKAGVTSAAVANWRTTTMLIGDRRWEQANNAGRTIATLYRDAMEADPSLRRFDLQQSIIKNAGGIRGGYGTSRPGESARCRPASA